MKTIIVTLLLVMFSTQAFAQQIIVTTNGEIGIVISEKKGQTIVRPGSRNYLAPMAIEGPDGMTVISGSLKEGGLSSVIITGPNGKTTITGDLNDVLNPMRIVRE